MSYTITRDADALTISIEGRLDVKTSPVIEAALEDSLPEITDLTVDLEGVDYVSSMGLRLLLAWQKRMFKQGSMRIINVGDEVMDLFEATGFSEILDIQ